MSTVVVRAPRRFPALGEAGLGELRQGEVVCGVGHVTHSLVLPWDGDNVQGAMSTLGFPKDSASLDW